MKCPSCGLEVAETASFCSHCGAALTSQGRVANAAAPVGNPANAPGPQAQTAGFVLGSAPDHSQEKVLWDENPSMRTAVPAIIAWIAGGIIASILTAVFIPNSNSTAEIIIIALVILVVLFVLIRYYVRFHSIRYRLSTQRIFITYGLFNKRTDEVELEKYKDIFVNQDFWDKIVGCGDIELVTGDVTNPTIKIIDITDPIGKKEKIRSAARERKSSLGITRREEL